jgi:nicotinate-nucleotide adenylyltransferase
LNITGVLGGTFDPIHFGHLRMAQELADALNLSEVRFIPAAQPPHRSQPVTSAMHRAAMVSLAIAGNPQFRLDERELQRSGPSYTRDSLQSLSDELGRDASICLFLGSDAFVKFNTWHRWNEILSLCHIALVERPATKETLPQELQNILRDHYTENVTDFSSVAAGFITMRKITALDISATRIRNSLQQNVSPRYLMPDNVIDYIRLHHLYR